MFWVSFEDMYRTLKSEIWNWTYTLLDMLEHFLKNEPNQLNIDIVIHTSS